jgi:hypothetical protein
MMKTLIAGMVLLVPAGSAIADPSHLIAVGGHDHLVAGVAIGAAVTVGLWGLLKGKRKPEASSADDAGETEDSLEAGDDLPQEA